MTALDVFLGFISGIADVATKTGCIVRLSVRACCMSLAVAGRMIASGISHTRHAFAHERRLPSLSVSTRMVAELLAWGTISSQA